MLRSIFNLLLRIFSQVSPNRRRLLILPLDMLLTALSFYLSGALLFDSLSVFDWQFYPGNDAYLKILLLLVLSKSVVFLFMGLYRSIWTYASTHDLFQIFKASILSSLTGISVIMLFNRFDGIPRSVVVLDGILLFLFLCVRSFSWRLFRDIFLLRLRRSGKRTLIIGGGIAGNRIATELRADHRFGLTPVGFLDDDPAKIGSTIHGLPVMNAVSELESCIESSLAEAVIITGTHKGASMRRIYRICEERNVDCKTLPPLNEMLDLNSRMSIGQSLRNLSLEDLLGREVVRLETEDIRRSLKNKTILISGAGGSIGSEVCRQLLNYDPTNLILVDNSETPLYEIDYNLRKNIVEENKDTRVVPIVGDIRNIDTVRRLFEAYDIHSVFHCAAYKHVPMMEINAGEAIQNNIIGTRILADASRDAGVERFVMISTDKAVNPTNIMGASKRVAELYVQNLARSADTKFITVRFGNVLGSNGSVIPLFKKQIAEGGPITVTHPDIIRYFMTIEEAAGLVIQAGTMGRGGEIFLLDMGEPVKILNLAQDMIRLSGYEPYRDIDIRFIGLRAGEKLYEELLLEGEGMQPTRHEKIRIAQARHINLNTIREQIEELRLATLMDSRAQIDEAISRILAGEYQPSRIQSEKSPKTDHRLDSESTPEHKESR